NLQQSRSVRSRQGQPEDLDTPIRVPPKSEPPAVPFAPEFLRPSPDNRTGSLRIQFAGHVLARFDVPGVETSDRARAGHPDGEAAEYTRVGLLSRALADRNCRTYEGFAAQRAASLLSGPGG